MKKTACMHAPSGGMMLSFAILASLCITVTKPVHAQYYNDDYWRNRERSAREWRERHYHHRHYRFYYNEPYTTYAPPIVEPPPYYYPQRQPGFNVIVPLRIR